MKNFLYGVSTGILFGGIIFSVVGYFYNKKCDERIAEIEDEINSLEKDNFSFEEEDIPNKEYSFE